MEPPLMVASDSAVACVMGNPATSLYMGTNNPPPPMPPPAASAVAAMRSIMVAQSWPFAGTRSLCLHMRSRNSSPVWKSKFYGAFVLNHHVVRHAIDATPEELSGAPDALVDFHTALEPSSVSRSHSQLVLKGHSVLPG